MWQEESFNPGVKGDDDGRTISKLRWNDTEWLPQGEKPEAEIEKYVDSLVW